MYSDNLSTDYKDAVWTGDRKYKITSNSDGTSGISDSTTYSTQGSSYGATDMNKTNLVIKEIEGEMLSNAKISIPSSGWSASTTTVDGVAYYTQAKVLTYIYNDSPVISLAAAGTLPTVTEQENYAKIAFAVADTSTATLTFYATEKPTGTIYVTVKEAK